MTTSLEDFFAPVDQQGPVPQRQRMPLIMVNVVGSSPTRPISHSKNEAKLGKGLLDGA